MAEWKIAAWVMLSVVAGCCNDAAPSVTPLPEGLAPSTRVREVLEAAPVAYELDLDCESFPWRVYSAIPLMYQPPCAPGQMMRVAASRRKTPAEELEQARAENTALHERLREMAEYEARVRGQ
ncbi:MAG: hypothetical protein JRG67_13305 [Deltaproteobacteria bacterium]|nr:hypothetical protein [Deltaproteobacteria bacterium]MBW2381114.1 hypothetical protein [Deltaproteobacteria bacterium]MBW2627627.1 hypothetical protein [Deltaproteobacteria bacterium]MBW2688130.1 hypothetical protein [Deltaproteobacteria bacterium]